MTKSVRPDLGSVIDLYDESQETRDAVSHNMEVLKCIRGGLRMAQHHRLSFDPRAEYWRPPERRLALAYLADRWTGRFAPAAALRSFAVHLVRHFDRARADGVVTYIGVDYEQVGGLPKICAALEEHAGRLVATPAWDALRPLWNLPVTAAEDVSAFLRDVAAGKDWEPGFRRRLPWFPFLGATSEEDLRRRQAFFYGFANLWTTANAYVRAGAQSFASVIQNTTSDAMLGPALQWAESASPLTTGFPTLSKDDEEPQDRAEYSTVVEVFGFLNLHRSPFYNNLAEVYRGWFGVSEKANAYELTAAVGEATRAWLDEHAEAVERLSALFRKTVAQQPRSRIEFESIESPRVGRKFAGNGGHLVDKELLAELERLAQEDLAKLGVRDAAVAALHFLLDSKLYLESLKPPVDPHQVSDSRPQSNERTAEHVVPGAAPPLGPKDVRRLPAGLRPYGERALTYLRAGLHVLFAGAPGTGKTTLAQFVGYAWDRGLEALPEQMPLASAPLTTVGNSAWSPFHTIGGLMPTERGTFTSHAGIFIDPSSASGDPWRLRSGAVVLDEMNRADLDRCIGELYPLLSGSVDRVSPAGLPGVRLIEAAPRFRILATVNDASLDDIVFPISEGLARRFLRIELPGASREDVLGYLGVGPEGQQEDRTLAVRDAVTLFFEVVRGLDLFWKAADDDRLPFGVGYFALLRAWLDGRLDAPVLEATATEQARELLAASLLTLGRTSRWEEALHKFLEKA